ncbi:uncharacterized protein LOC127082449 [Lathyrus oleraceus]|uniref:uncharacterized protein LOC127082449 n=1 Tax=Pisum sativum TaxID=3888 RepID=UPI0021D2F2EA|nr:uncharacterized protein LOC127082449 [Pisum sativum]
MTLFEALYDMRCKTHLCWYDSGESVLLGPEIVKQTSEKIKMIQENMKALQSYQKSYHNKRRKKLEFQEGDHVFFRFTLVTGVGRALKSRELTSHFIGPYQILKRLRKHIPDPSHVIQVDDVQVRENLTVEISPLRVEDHEVKKFRGK